MSEEMSVVADVETLSTWSFTKLATLFHRQRRNFDMNRERYLELDPEAVWEKPEGGNPDGEVEDLSENALRFQQYEILLLQGSTWYAWLERHRGEIPAPSEDTLEESKRGNGGPLIAMFLAKFMQVLLDEHGPQQGGEQEDVEALYIWIGLHMIPVPPEYAGGDWALISGEEIFRFNFGGILSRPSDDNEGSE